ncbi:hypothetical protein [Caudoviricetes sp.]|nr:hypothetical protein [Caudoviricetes sp.]
MIDAIDSALDYINGLRTMLATDNALLRDIRVEVPGVTDGTLDVAIYDGTNLHVLDYKNGAGVPVTARENSQMGLYALGCESLLKRKFKKVVLHIIQPRCNRRANPADDWTASRKWLDDLSSRAYSAVKNADDPHAEFKPSDKGCRWCKAKAVCPALARVALGEAKQDFGIIDGTAAPCKIDKQSVAKPLTPDQLTAAFQNLPLVFAWAEAVEKEVLSRLENGKPVPGLKLVEGRANRQWSDEKNAINALMREGLDMDDIAPRTIVGIGKAEKLLPKDKREQVMNRLTVRPAGKPTIAPADDPRPPITGDAANDFADHIEDPLLR